MDYQKDIRSSYNNSHVLLLPYPTQGHINPILQFAKRLVSKGTNATLATSTFVHNSMYAKASTSNLNIDFETISDGYDRGRSTTEIKVYLETFRYVGSRTLAELIIRLRDSSRPVDAVVYDAFLPWALDVAKDFGLVGAVFFTQSLAVNTVYYHIHKGLLRLPLSEKTVSFPTLPPLEISETPSFVYSPESYPGFYYMVVNQFSNIDKADLVLFNSFHELENKTVEWMEKLWPVRTIGPTVPSIYLDERLENDKDYNINLWKPKDDTCISWLNDKSFGTVVYVSFGSLSALEAEQMGELAWGLKRSNQYFLWVVRESEETKLPLELFKDKTFEKGLIVNWCPQLAVLAHKSVECFVTHCGFNSTLEALSLGVPLVAMPQWTDQTTNAKYVEDVWGVGIRARPDENGIVRREVVENCIKELMEGEKGKKIKKNVIKWRDLARQAVSQGGSSDKNIDEFVAKLSS
ncbi:UDP-glucuronosyl/UDP-glucosyltransferase [Parasponia andersonii]|uniref:Glycosyltransferase n=1 Tax=Parasponia andersonii TaxID=3476 RepID=A0A2P5DPD8_PARAD|nr:UDP-glucuronosyl/UDP-glucosyltransferase [Parasponia andersonii]